MFKTEMHLHTSPVSMCGRASPEYVVDQYLRNDYSTIVVTNHFQASFFEKHIKSGLNKTQIIDFYLSDYRRAKDYAMGRMNVLLGLEFRNIENDNDYLIYGIDEGFLYTVLDFTKCKLPEVCNLIHEYGGMIFQAHPFRNGIKVTDPRNLDGIEAGNFSFLRDDRNDVAEFWADKYQLKKVYGTDYHLPKQMRGAGILTDLEIKTNEMLLDVLKKQSFQATDGKNIITV